MYVLCVYIAMSKSQQTAKFSPKKAETSVILIYIDGVLCDVRAYVVTVFLPSLNMTNVPKNYILTSDRT